MDSATRGGTQVPARGSACIGPRGFAKGGAVRSRRLQLLAPILGMGLAAGSLAMAGAVIGGTGRDADPSIAQAQPRSPTEGPDVAASGPAEETEYRCVQPAMDIPQTEACAAGRGYPDCRWQLPEPDARAPYTIWRNTTPEHRWGRPGLVSLVLGSAAEYRRRWLGERVAVGDLDAPGPRHSTHDRGVDVDLYLTEAMMTRNEGRGRYVDNYQQRSRTEVRSLRARVMHLAHVLAVCAEGQVRIYYNDPEIIRPFREWFDARGLVSSVGPAMRSHNRLHEFHFHLTIDEERPPLPIEPADDPR